MIPKQIIDEFWHSFGSLSTQALGAVNETFFAQWPNPFFISITQLLQFLRPFCTHDIYPYRLFRFPFVCHTDRILFVWNFLIRL